MQLSLYLQIKVKKMKTLSLLHLLFGLVGILPSVQAQTYTTIAAGNWNSNTVWSLDGGTTPCNCNPGNNPNGPDFVINHHVTLVANTRLRNAVVTINGNNGQISGNFNLRLDENTVTTVKAGGSIANVNQVLVQNNSVLIVEDNAFIGTGINMQIQDGSTLNVHSGGEVYLNNFHMQGNSTLILNGFMEVANNFTTTNSNHSVSGSGGLLVHGNIDLGNNTNWSGLAWCLNGGGTSDAPPAHDDCDYVYAIQGSLPVQLVKFQSRIVNNTVLLEWTTASEVNNNFFVVERSANAIEFEPLDTLQGAGTTDHPVDYTFTDNSPLFVINYYRLRQVDFDGSHNYSPVISAQIDITVTEPQISIYPNPSQGAFYIKTMESGQLPQIKALFTAGGKTVNIGSINYEVNIEEGMVKISGLELGHYIIYLNVNNQNVVRQLIVQP
ncbi:MAG: hypothetical protein KatS3mg032_2031 [Cyclobacteriaceae bacterium]|nr:MAG: hypothetical protein KatS3mg032_2031 [Cyclobacteriaceae bacterium]